eukprot:TRINITY_DN67460_c0_g1_i1.p1 TRINITY_DN67460_c0_g1~~TRINITY_DN67460_c0_g1_i1.p1  ORF type:complete len:395 (-),score=60.10 TRINITY_DN67460_c0_g1_i1:168-1352(-)
MEHCGVCEGTGLLLNEPCPLCEDQSSPETGVNQLVIEKTFSDQEDNDGGAILFTVNEDGVEFVVPSTATNAFFIGGLTMSGWVPPNFRISISLRTSGCIIISDVDATTARRIADIIESTPPLFLKDDLPPITALLQILGLAEWRRANISVVGGPKTPAEAVCIFYDELCIEETLPEAYATLIHTSEVLPRVYRLHAHHRIVIASMFFRLQEFYESPVSSIRGKMFSVIEYMERGIRTDSDAFEYYLRWPGFNLPSRIIEAARGGGLGRLMPREEALLASIDRAKGDFQGEYYVIGTCENAGALMHEMAHGLYALNPGYRQEVQDLLDLVSEEDTAAMRQKLLDMGYCDDEEILQDEMQAYMAGGEDLVDTCVVARRNIQQTFHNFSGVQSAPLS